MKRKDLPKEPTTLWPVEMKIDTLSNYLLKIEKTSSRNEMTEILAELLKKSSLEEIDKICYLSLGNLKPRYNNLEFNMAEKLVLRSIAMAFGKDISFTQKKYQQSGDLGTLVESLSSSDSKNNPPVTKVYDALVEIAQDEGQGSQERKITNLAMLIKSLSALSGKYIIRIPIKKLRLGFSEATILDALSWMLVGDKSLRDKLQDAYNISADIGKISKLVKKDGIKGIREVSIETGIPIMSALTEREASMKKIIERMEGRGVAEPKYDGFRVQIHIDKSKKIKTDKQNDFFSQKEKAFVKIYSRNLEDITHMMPEIIQGAEKLNVDKAIIDGEAIGINPTTGKFLPFQETTQRKRKYDIRETLKKIPLKVFAFDLLFLNDKTLLKKPLKERKTLLEKTLDKSTPVINLTEQTPIKTTNDLKTAFNKYMSLNLEGAVIKDNQSIYYAGQRKYVWIKLKRAMDEKLTDTVDCLVMGYYLGKGKRNKFGIGAFLVGVLDKKSGNFCTIARIGTGLTDDQWKELKLNADKLSTLDKPESYNIPKTLLPDVWCLPELVVEIEADEITRSPIHTCKLALRFPRLKRFRSKVPEQATTIAEVKKLYKIQTNKK